MPPTGEAITFRPANAAQRRFMQSQAGELLYSGGWGAGKTRIGCEKAHMLAQHYPGNRILVARKVNADLPGSTLQVLLPPGEGGDPEEIVIPDSHVIQHHKQEQRITVLSRDPERPSTIWYGGLDRRTKFGSTEYGYVFVDEANELDENDWKWLLGRARLSRAPFHQVAAATNPSGPRHWLHERFFQADDPDRLVVQATPEDNPHLAPAYKRKLRRLEGTFRRRYVEGEWVAASGRVFSTFSPDEHVRRPKWVEERTWGIAHGGADWGWTHDACLGVGLQKGEWIHLLEIVHEDHLTKSELADEAAAATQRYDVAKWWCDSSDPENIRAFQERGLAAEGCSKVGPADRRDALVDRFKGGTLTVDPTATHLIDQLLMLEETDRKTGKPWKDGPDHAVDMAGYLVVRADRATRIRAE